MKQGRRNDEANHHNINHTQAVSPRLTSEQNGKQPMVFDNRNKIAVNKQKIFYWVPNLKGGLSAESKSMPAKPAVKPLTKPNSKPKVTPPTGSKAVKSDSTSRSGTSSSNQQNEVKKV